MSRLFDKQDKLVISDYLRLNSNAKIRVQQASGADNEISLTELQILDGATVTTAELNRTADASARVVTTTATALSLTVTEHAERVVLVNTNSTVANTFTLPAAAGTGEVFTVINNIAQTQGTVVVAANGTDVMTGNCVAVDSSGASNSLTFQTTATSDKVSLNLTTTGGGVGYDKIVAVDIAANTWHVEVLTNCTGSQATPFSAT